MSLCGAVLRNLAKEAAAVRDEGATVRVEATKKEYDLAFVLSNSLMEHHLGVKKEGDDA